jgi:hypothetical protein
VIDTEAVFVLRAAMAGGSAQRGLGKPYRNSAAHDQHRRSGARAAERFAKECNADDRGEHDGAPHRHHPGDERHHANEPDRARNFAERQGGQDGCVSLIRRSARRSGALAVTRSVFGGNERLRRLVPISERRAFRKNILALLLFTEDRAGVSGFCADNRSFVSLFS